LARDAGTMHSSGRPRGGAPGWDFSCLNALTIARAPDKVTRPSERPPKTFRCSKETFRQLQYVWNSPLGKPGTNSGLIGVCPVAP
jgi:hypothetical protein